MLHALKIEPQYFEDVADGKKSFEIRKNDRDFQVGDFLALNELDDCGTDYTGRFLLAKIVYILDADRFLQSDYVCLGIVPVTVYANEDIYNYNSVNKIIFMGYQIYGG